MTTPPPHHDSTVPLNLATTDDLVHELSSRTHSLIVGFVRIDPRGRSASRVHRTGDQVSCLGLTKIIEETIVRHILSGSIAEDMNKPPTDHSAGEPDEG